MGILGWSFTAFADGKLRMARKKKERIKLDQSQGFGGTLGAQFGEKMGVQAKSSSPGSARDTARHAPEPSKSQSVKTKIEMRVTRKGYGGKTVTECRGLDATDRAAATDLSRALSKALGVRVFWKGDICCVQGDQVARLVPYFESEGHETHHRVR